MRVMVIIVGSFGCCFNGFVDKYNTSYSIMQAPPGQDQ